MNNSFRWIGRIFCALLLGWNGAAWHTTAQTGQVSESPLIRTIPDEELAIEGEKLARQYCASCHLFAEPALLDKATWRDQTLPRMKIRMGLAPLYLEKHPEADLLKATGVFPETPMISEKEFQAILYYYVNRAPSLPHPQQARPPIQNSLKLFKPDRPRYRRPVPMTSLVKISGSGGRIYLGDSQAQTLDILDKNGVFLEALHIKNTPVSLAETELGLFLTCIGRFLPSEKTLGELILMEPAGGSFKPGRIILQDLPRTTHTEFADLNGDGRLDFVLCAYGNTVGRFSWYENLGDQRFKEHVLIPKPGAIRSVVQDLNKDGRPDLVVLMAQELESMFVLMNEGKGQFTTHTILQQHPLYGHSSFELADFNGDQLPDLLVTNGDNGEYKSPLKNYHGVRIYLNKGGLRFEQSAFYPLNGAYGALGRDFDQDGDLDIAAISFFPDYENSPGESFVYLENLGDLKFSASTFRECVTGRWLSLDAGDLDGDGDLDLVLGSYTQGPTDVPEFFAKLWERLGPSVLILRNQLRHPAE